MGKSGSVYLLVSLFTVFSSYAQDRNDIETLLKAGVVDLGNYVDQYMKPAAKGFTYSFGSGWIQTAETHNTLGFDVKLAVSASAVPGSYKTFLFRNQDFDHIRLQSGDQAELPTLFGPQRNNPMLEILEDQQVVASLPAPQGAGLPIQYVPAPILQAGLGLPSGTDLKIRWIPKTKLDDTQISSFGLGLQHDLKQHIPVIRHLPFHLSGLVAYNSFRASNTIDVEEGQFANYRIGSWTAQALVSKKLAFLTLYGSVGYNHGTTGFDLVGDYSYSAEAASITDPISLKYSILGPMASMGLRLKFGPLFINGDYTFQEFNILTVGLGVSIN